jgi:rRNA-processing protein EBP2
MARDKKLKAALDRYKGVDYKLERQKKLQKDAEKKRKRNQRSRISELREEEYLMSGALTLLEEKKEPVSESQENGEKPAQSEALAEEENLWDTEEDDDDEDEDGQDEGLEVPGNSF